MKPAWHDVVASLRSGIGSAAGSGPVSRTGTGVGGADLDAQRRQAAARLRLLMTRVGSVGWTTDADLRLVTCSGSGLEAGIAPEQLIGRSLEDVLPPGEDGREALMAHARALEGESADYESEWLGRRWQVHLEPLVDRAGRTVGVVGAALDVTRVRRLEQDLADAAHRDGLTGLPSRVAFVERLYRTAQRAEWLAGASFAVLLVNLDGFKTVNDNFGPAAGDALLREVARRILGTLRAGDTAARFGGDEFTILLEDTDGADPVRVADRVLRVLSAPVELNGRQVSLQASIGIALGGKDQSPEEVLRNAEIAMFQAKTHGKARFEVFDRPLDARSMSLLRVEVELRRALEREEFRTHYAPTVAVKGGKVSGFEVLLWRRSAGARR